MVVGMTDLGVTYAGVAGSLDLGRAACVEGRCVDEVEWLRGVAAGVEDLTRQAVAAARLDGASWSVIGAALGISKQAAAKRFGDRHPTPGPRKPAGEDPLPFAE